MSDIHRDDEKSFSISNQRRNSKDDNERYHRKRTNSTKSNDYSNSQRISNIDAKVYVGNVPTENLTDGELLDFFKPFGKVSDIRVYKGYIFVQYDRIDDARKLIKQGQTSLILKGNKLDILPAMEASSTNTKSSFNEHNNFQRDSSRNSRRHSDHDRHSSNYEPPRKRYALKHTDDQHRHRSRFITNNTNSYRDSDIMEIDDNITSSKSCSRRSPIDSSSYYTVLIGPDDSRQIVDCQIIIVNPRQRSYGEEISSRLRCHGLVTSVILLREDYTLTEAIENAAREQCLYGVIAMPMHEERRTASFHILHGQTEEHRNLTLEDGYHIVLTNFSKYREDIQKGVVENNPSIIYPQSEEFLHQDQPQPSTLSIGDKLPLSMLLCLLADGRQLTLDEIDRVLVYLLEKKAKMLTLPQGTLPPLPAQYATIKQNNQTGCGASVDQKSISSSSELSSTIAEQIRQILSSNIVKSSLTEDLSPQHIKPKTSFEPLRDLNKAEDTNICQTKNNIKEGGNDYNHYQQISQREVQSEQQKTSSTFSYSKSNSNSVAVVAPSFHYSSSSMSNNGAPPPSSSYIPSSFPSYDSAIQSLRMNSPLKQLPTSISIPNFGIQSTPYMYSSSSSLSTENLYQTLPNSSAADAAAAIFQAYSQFNARSTSIPSIINQQTNAQTRK